MIFGENLVNVAGEKLVNAVNIQQKSNSQYMSIGKYISIIPTGCSHGQEL